jgi:hypothetical protein
VIPESSIHFNEDGTAWLVLYDDAKIGGWAWWKALDRPCDTCNGFGTIHDTGDSVANAYPCPNCINGRDTFTLEVGDWNQADHTVESYCELVTTLRVSIREGMVLSIYGNDHEHYDTSWIEIWPDGSTLLFVWSEGRAEHFSEHITLPPDARPGMWAVLLDAHDPASLVS